MADKFKAAAAKLLKDLHEQKQIEGRPAGECGKLGFECSELMEDREADRISCSSSTSHFTTLQHL